MGTTPSSPSPPPPPPLPTAAENEAAEEKAQELEAQTADEELQQEIADQIADDKAITTQTNRDKIRSNALDAARAKNGFKRPPSNTGPLSVANSAGCNTCTLTIDPTLSSATVVLSRNILGKTRPPSTPLPPSNLPSRPTATGLPTKIPDGNDGKNCAGGCWYAPPFRSDDGGKASPPTDKSVAKGTLLSDKGVEWANNSGDYTQKYKAQWQEEKKNRLKFLKESTKDKTVRIWNPSDDPTDAYGSLALNYTNYGALTKLYLKPTIPFQFTFDPTGLSAVAPASDVKKIEPTSSQRLATPSTAPLVRRAPTL